LSSVLEAVHRNDWPFVHPQTVEIKAPDDILVTRQFDEAAKRLSEGGKVLWIPRTDDLRWDCPPVGTLPIFWNRLMGPAWERFLGLLCDPAHPALADFAANAHYEWQWQEVVRPYCPRRQHGHAPFRPCPHRPDD
jgi:hypothetical protein